MPNAPTPQVVTGVGQLNYIDFPVTACETSSSLLPISLNYETNNNSAAAAPGDYTATNGTLTWAPGDTSTKYIRVPVGTGLLVEISKQFSLSISNPANPVFEYTTTVATIKYSVFNTSTSPVTTQSTDTAQSVTFNPLESATYGDSPVSLTASDSTIFPVAFSVISGPGTISGNNLTISGAESIVVKATQAGDSLYAPSSTRQTQVVKRANQTITFGSLGNAIYGGSPISLAGNSSSSLAVPYSIVSGPGSISSNSLTITESGTVIIQASQPGNNNYNAATAVQSSLVVQQAVSTT